MPQSGAHLPAPFVVTSAVVASDSVLAGVVDSVLPLDVDGNGVAASLIRSYDVESAVVGETVCRGWSEVTRSGVWVDVGHGVSDAVCNEEIEAASLGV